MARGTQKRMPLDAGFSIVETMVAMLIFASVSAAGVAILISFNSGQQALATADDFIAEVQLTRGLIRGDLEHALPRPVRDAFGGMQPMFTGGVPTTRLLAKAGDVAPFLAFVRGGHMAARVSDTAPALQRVEYALKDDALVRRAYARPDVTPATPVTEQVLMHGVKSVSVRFRSSDTWVVDWHGKAGSAGSLPKVVELSLELDGRGTLTSLYTVGASS
ncbi:type II secretion system minor pseudopilin GspJ [Kordiimonas sp.]|uniref:type II secretion system minor pseudopilin GspJ n=2 Tax=Kordiimonas sp. TaxID=1970157 RepID=UPI003A8EDB4A